MRAIAGILAYIAVVTIAVLMLIYDWNKKRKKKFK
jgi:hypothetical protein